MEIKLNVYTTRALRNIEKTYSVEDFRLSTGACEDLLDIINIDMFDGDLDVLSDESKVVELLRSITGGIQVFKELLKDIFEGLNDDEIRRTDVAEILGCVAKIITYSINGLSSAFSGKN